MKSAEEIMNVLEAYDLTGSYRDAAVLAGGCSHHTVAHYVALRAAGELTVGRGLRRPQLIEEFLPKLEELVERSHGRIRADVAHRKLAAMGFTGSERTTRRAVAALKAAWQVGHRRVHRPWIPEPGMWAQYDFGTGPRVAGVGTVLFCFWLAWSRFRVVSPLLEEDAAERARRDRRGAASGRWGADLPAHRQREDGDRRAHRRAGGAAPGRGGLRPALRADGGDLCAGGPGFQGR